MRAAGLDYPELAPGERAVAETRLGRATAVLTDRRVVVTGPSLEQSLPLAQIALVRVRFERVLRSILAGLGLLAAAAVLLGVAAPLRTVLLNQSVALEHAASEERTAHPDSRGGIASGMQRVLAATAGLVGLFPAAGWLLAAGGVALIGLGAVGRTVVSVAAGGAEVELTRPGNSRALRDFVAEVGRSLPAPRR